MLGLLGNNDLKNAVDKVEELCKQKSSKQVKSNIKKEVKFDFKIKGQKPVVTKDICQFSITGGDFPLDNLGDVLKEHGFEFLE